MDGEVVTGLAVCSATIRKVVIVVAVLMIDGLSDVMAQLESGLPDRDAARDIEELRAAVGLEGHESTSDNAATAAQPG